MSVIRGEYGRQVLLKMKCPKCGYVAIVLDGEMQCCGAVVVVPSHEKIKRYSRGEDTRARLNRREKESIMEMQNGKCIYCGGELNEIYLDKKNNPRKRTVHYDHFVSWNYSGNSSVNNMFASCHTCNLIKSDLYFDSIETATKYIMEKRRYRDDIPKENNVQELSEDGEHE